MPTVLIVDDEAPVREVVAQMLRQAGYGTMLAVDGRDAWAQLHRGRPIDAVLADVVMPTMTGTELLALILAHRPELPIALMSGYAAEALSAWGLEEPPVPFLTKPFSPDTLLAEVRRLLSLAAPPDQV